MTRHAQQLVRLLQKFDSNEPLIGAEVGVDRGATSRVLLQDVPNLSLFLIDTWHPPAKDSAYYRTGDPCATRDAEDYEAAYQDVLDLVVQYPAYRVHTIKLDSTEAAKQLPQLDFVFLDGDHSYEGCIADIETYWSLVRSGGLLAGHDYWLHQRFPHTRGVRRAVNEFCRDLGRKPRVGQAGVWWIWK